MPFDWDKYKELAEELRLKDDEAAKRSAISRLYYSIYHKAKNFLEDTSGNFIFSENKPAHQQVWNEFIKTGGTDRNIGSNGKRLLDLRVDADYKEIYKIDDELETSFRIANNILTYLQQIEKRRKTSDSNGS